MRTPNRNVQLLVARDQVEKSIGCNAIFTMGGSINFVLMQKTMTSNASNVLVTNRILINACIQFSNLKKTLSNMIFGIFLPVFLTRIGIGLWIKNG